MPITCRLFQEGGNYCPEEIELFEKKMASTKEKNYAFHDCIFMPYLGPDSWQDSQH